MKPKPTLAVLFLAASLALPAPAAPAAGTSGDTVALDGWDYRAAYDGWRASALLDAVVLGENGEELGAVQDLLVSADGRLRALTVEASGMLEIGPATFVVPWRAAGPGPEPDTVTLPLTADQAAALADASPADAAGPGGWRAQTLLGRPVHVSGARDFGTVDDLIFDAPGHLVAVAVAPRHAPGGPYAYPWSEVTMAPAQSALMLPATPSQLRALGPFDYDRMPDGAIARR